MQGELHVNDVIRLKSIFRHHLEKQGNIKVYCDMKIIWGIEGLKNPAPDISVVRDVKNPEEPRSVFNVPEEGTKPFFVLEVVSPRYRNADINKKPEIYRKAGVSEYIIADPGLENGMISYTVSGYRMMGGRYFRMKPDRLGRITSVTAGIMIGPAESGARLAVYDAMTGEEILSDEERAEYAENLAEQEKIRAEYAENLAEQEKARAEQEKARAEYAENLAQQEKIRAEQEKIRAEQEKARAETAEKELIRLKAKMKASGISEE